MTPSGSGSGENTPPEAEGSNRGSLSGLRILNTREAGTAGELTARLTALGAMVVERPMLAFVPPESWEPFDRRLEDLRPEDWVAFTSATAVRFTMERLNALGQPAQVLASAHLAAVGATTSAALQACGLPVELVPENFQAEGLLAALLERLPAGGRVWLPRAEKAREVLTEGLAGADVEVTVTPVYRTVMPKEGLGEAWELLESGGLDWIVFTSSSTVSHLARMLTESMAKPAVKTLAAIGAKIACLGSVTAETARLHGLEVSVLPDRQDLHGLIDALVAHVTNAPEQPGVSPAINGTESMSEPNEELTILNQRARQFLVHSFLYYRLGESVIGDDFFDQLVDELRSLRKKHPKARIPHGDLIDAQLGAEASGFAIKKYPPEVISAAFKLIYAVNSPPVDFTEFVEQHGYRTVTGRENPS